ncbi:MAG: amidohydrolase family protein [Ilumatobacteraceae bacterium]
MLTPDTPLISVDDHIVEPPDLWVTRLPKHLHEEGPRVVELESGRQAWKYEDTLTTIVAGSARVREDYAGSIDFNEVRWREGREIRYDEMRPGCYDPVERLKDMDTERVDAELCFPTFGRFTGHRFMASKDKELGLLCIKAYNDFVIDEWCATDPHRLLSLAVLPLWDIEQSVIELKRVLDRGVHALAFSENPTMMGLPSIHTTYWDPIWSLAAEAELPICMHIGSSSKMITSSDDAPLNVGHVIIGVNSMIACADWLHSNLFVRFPNLRIVLSEGGIGWVPYVLERATRMFHKRGTETGSVVPPQELFRDHVFVCMVADQFGIDNLDQIGTDNVMWESDYPHDESDWPDSRVLLEQALAKVPDDIARKIACETAQRVFRIAAR